VAGEAELFAARDEEEQCENHKGIMSGMAYDKILFIS
jgi:hypothetical protein